MSDARVLLEQLNALPKNPSCSNDPSWVVTLNRWRQQFWEHSSEQLEKLSSTPLHPHLVIDAFNRHLKQPHLLFADPGTPTPYLGRFLRFDDEQSRLIIPRAYGGLGYAIPAVVGAWYTRPDIKPIGLFVDGSLGMAAGDLETIVRLKVPAILLNFNNSCFGWIKALQRLHGIQNFLSVDFSTQDYSALAEAFGLRSIHVESLTELDSALDLAFAHDGPFFLDISVESIADEIPPVFNWLRKTGVDPLTIGGNSLVLDIVEAKETVAS